MRRYRALHKGKTRHRPFVGVDGEGGDIDGRHELTCLRAGDQELFTGKPLATWQCLSFLASLPVGPIYVGYFFGYDSTMILKDLPQSVLNLLIHKELRKKVSKEGKEWTWNCRYRGFDIEFASGPREFKIRRVGTKDKHYTTIYDVGSIFQCRFLKALKDWKIGTPQEWKVIDAGKKGRGSWGIATPEIRAYNALECTLLAQMMEKVRDACDQVEIHPMKWTGAGQLAESLLRSHHTNEYQGPLPSHLEIPAATAYYGGRFEILRQGVVNDVYEYDINSAYPAAMRTLPCIAHGAWVQGRRDRCIRLAHVAWSGGDASSPQPFPFRTQQGRIVYPCEGGGWYWGVEIDAAIACDRWRIVEGETWSWVQSCDHKPFDWIEGLYKFRKSLKDGRGTVLKLAMNSLYGKMAQSIGKPRYRSIVMAGMITASVRAQMLRDAIEHDGGIMFATDAVYFQSPAKVRIGEGLGEYGEQHFDEYFIMEPGFHFGVGSMVEKAKTRGVPVEAVNPEGIVELWKKEGREGVVAVPHDKFWGVRLCNETNRMDMVGQWTKEVRNMRFDAVLSKRRYGAKEGDAYRLLAYKAIQGRKESMPYKKAMAMLDLDWMLTIADGEDYNQFYEALEGLKEG